MAARLRLGLYQHAITQFRRQGVIRLMREQAAGKLLRQAEEATKTNGKALEDTFVFGMDEAIRKLHCQREWN